MAFRRHGGRRSSRPPQSVNSRPGCFSPRFHRGSLIDRSAVGGAPPRRRMRSRRAAESLYSLPLYFDQLLVSHSDVLDLACALGTGLVDYGAVIGSRGGRFGPLSCINYTVRSDTGCISSVSFVREDQEVEVLPSHMYCFSSPLVSGKVQSRRSASLWLLLFAERWFRWPPLSSILGSCSSPFYLRSKQAAHRACDSLGASRFIRSRVSANMSVRIGFPPAVQVIKHTPKRAVRYQCLLIWRLL